MVIREIMITEKDIKGLKFLNTKFAKVFFYILLFFPIFSLIIGGLNLYLASMFGENAGFSIGNLFKSWIEGIDIHKQYSGLYIKALERLQASLSNFIFSIFLFCLPVLFIKVKKRNERFLNSLIQNGVIKG